MATNLKWLFRWEGRVSRRQYFLAGVLLMLLKYAIDSTVARFFGQAWHFWYYVVPPNQASLWRGHVGFYAVLWAVAIPFFWMGIMLTVRRLRDIGRSAAWSLLYFLPLVNLAFFVALTLTASNPNPIPYINPPGPPRFYLSSLLSVLITSALGYMLVQFSTETLVLYGWGLFFGVPFLLGFVSAWLLNLRALHTSERTIAVGIETMILTAALLFGSLREGMGCLIMALPLALPFGMAGSIVAWQICAHRRRALPPKAAAFLLMVPLLMLGEHAARLQPPLHPVITSVVIDAPPAVVWKQLVAFSQLEPPEEWYFRAGIAYPTTAKIVGSGPGATRYCRFSTGDFVEPITVWEENRLLAFNVSAEPPSMRELSPGNITPPHLEHNYFRSQRGQFRLVPVSGGRTLLEGTTWYQDYYWPQAYWQAWSDAIVHRIHLRVLRHVKTEAERQAHQESSR